MLSQLFPIFNTRLLPLPFGLSFLLHGFLVDLLQSLFFFLHVLLLGVVLSSFVWLLLLGFMDSFLPCFCRLLLSWRNFSLLFDLGRLLFRIIIGIVFALELFYVLFGYFVPL